MGKILQLHGIKARILGYAETGKGGERKLSPLLNLKADYIKKISACIKSIKEKTQDILTRIVLVFS
jgi:hypothetical protein